MVDLVSTLNEYKIPSHEILKNRRTFHGLQKEVSESVDRWLKRVQLCIDCCEFPTVIIEFLLIDRFVCGLNVSELKCMESVDIWTVKHLLEYYFNDQNIKHAASISEKDATGEDVKVGQNRPMDDMNVELVSSSQKCE